jgi:acetoin utilization protein AcuC
MKTALIHTDAYSRFDYGPEHPLRMERLGLTWRLMAASGLTSASGIKVLTPQPATEAAILRYHTQDYIEVLKSASAGLSLPEAFRYGLGPGDNPIFPGCWEAACFAAGGSLLAAKLVADGEADRAFHFAGGLHHALPDRASGFCYLNDAVLAIAALVDAGYRVAYVDIDAHHGDGVQHAFYKDPRVLTISTHERGDRLFPGTGFVEEIGEGAGRGYSVNLPLQPFTEDEVYLPAFEAVVPPLLSAFKPDVVVAQLGIDSHRTDPLTHLSLTVQGFTRAVRRLVELSPKLVALGGGGYDLSNVARAWTSAWAVMNGIDLPAELPASFEADARAHRFAHRSLWDPADPFPPEIRKRAEEYAARQVDALRLTIFPLHGLKT